MWLQNMKIKLIILSHSRGILVILYRLTGFYKFGTFQVFCTVSVLQWTLVFISTSTMPENRKRKLIKSKTKTHLLDLPPDVLHLILTRLNHSSPLSLSFVSKYFKTLIDPFVRNLRFDRLPSTSDFRKLVSRFTSVTRIVINTPSLVTILNVIADSTLKIQDLSICNLPTRLPRSDHMISLSNRFGDVKVLKLNWSPKSRGFRVVDFIHMFQSLEELDLSGCTSWNDEAIVKLASNAKNLRKINLTGNNDLTSRSLDALSNCVNLESISLDNCRLITVRSFCAFIRKKPNLKLIEVPYERSYFPGLIVQQGDMLSLAEAISCCENLSHLAINEGLLQDSLLSVIAKSRSTLTSLVHKMYLSSPEYGYTMVGLSVLLRAFPSLTKLHICLPWSRLDTLDMEMSQLVESLVHLKDVCFFSHTSLDATQLSLIRNCPDLESIHPICSTERNKIHCVVDAPQLLVRRPCSIRCICTYRISGTLTTLDVITICLSKERSILKQST